MRHRQCTKLIVAASEDQHERLAQIKANGEANGVTDLEWRTGEEAMALGAFESFCEVKSFFVRSTYGEVLGVETGRRPPRLATSEAQHEHLAHVMRRCEANGVTDLEWRTGN